MEHPVHEIPPIIATLCQGTRAEQESALYSYFVPEAYFTHPFCRVPSFGDVTLPFTSVTFNSRALLWFIYQWYRILSPRIAVAVDSCVYDQRTRRLYCTIRQTFTLWFVPLRLWTADVELVTVLRLEQRAYDRETGHALERGNPRHEVQPQKLFIAGQEDLYQVGEFLKFVSAPFGLSFVWFAWQLLATAMCVVGTLVFWPVNLARDRLVVSERTAATTDNGNNGKEGSDGKDE